MVRSHILMVVFVFMFTLYFYLCNRGKIQGETVVCFYILAVLHN